MNEYWDYLVSAIALLMVFEGILPFLSPRQWRRMMMRLAEQSDQVLRSFGAISMGLGVGLILFLHSGMMS